MKVFGRFSACLVGLGVWASASPALAWVETHVVSDDVRVELERTGLATIDHAVTMQIKGGPLRSFDLALADADVSPLDGTVVSAQTEGLLGLPIPLGVTPRPGGGLRVTVESPRGVSRGLFLFHVRYKKSLLAQGGVKKDGAMLRATWTGPVWPEGLDNAKCTFVLPAAPTEPRAPGIGAKDDPNEDGDESEAGIFVSQVRRSPDRDEVELMRPHVARGEAVRWSVRLDPRALGEVNDPRLRPPPPAPKPEIIPAEKRAAYASGAGLLLIGFSLLGLCKARQVGQHTRGVAEPRPLVPLGTPLRALLAGPSLVGGIALQLGQDDPMWGTLLVLFAMTLVWYLQPTVHRSPRGPGRWLPLADDEAFARPARPKDAWLDGRTPIGFLLFALLLAGSAGLAYAASHVSAYDAYLIVFDSAVFFPLFGTGGLRDLPGHPLSGPGPALGTIARKLRSRRGCRAIAWARLPEGSDRFDELRLLCAPKIPLRGFVGIEVGLVGTQGIGGLIHLPELLVRAVDATPCHEALLRLLPGSRWMRGRRADERVTSLRPRLPTVAMTAALVTRLIEHVRDTSPPRAQLPRPDGRRQVAPAAAPKSAKVGNAVVRSVGSADRTSKAGTVASPFQAMRLA